LNFSQKDYFYKSAKVLGDDIPKVEAIFKKAGYHGYNINEEQDFLEFHVGKLKTLGKLEIEIGISSHVIEMRQKELVLRELKVDVTTPQTVRLSKDI